jgi:putative transposase
LDLPCCKSPDLRVNLGTHFPLAMSRKYKIRDRDKLYFVTFTVLQRLDPPAADTAFFTRREYRTFFSKAGIVRSIKDWKVCAYCIMSSHIHMILGRNSEPNLEGIIRDVKKYTSLKIIEAITDKPAGKPQRIIALVV